MKVFLVVTIPTHLRVLTETADLLQKTGRYRPSFVYFPSAVFDQNYANCRESAYEAFIWNGQGFDARRGSTKHLQAPESESQVQSSATDERQGELRAIPPVSLQRKWARSIYTAARHVFPFLPPARRILDVIRPVRAMAYRVSRAGRSIFIRFVTSIRARILLQAKPTTLNAILLQAFAEEWGDLRPGERGIKSFARTARKIVAALSHEEIYQQKLFHDRFAQLIEQEQPSLIVLPEENFFYNHHLMVHAACLQNVPTCIVPFTIVNTLEWAEGVYNEKSYDANSYVNRIFALAFPHWVLSHRGRKLILPPSYVLTCEYLRVTPDNPWLINSGPAEAIAAESQFMYEYYVRAGIRRQKIFLTGTPSDDILFQLLASREKHKSEVGTRNGIDIGNRVVLIALPPDAFAARANEPSEFKRYEELIEFMVSTFTSLDLKDWSILINLHPRVQLERVRWIENLGAKIIFEPIESLVPLADVYVAVVSATIRLAISCGIPAVNFDPHNYNYDDYKDLDGVIEVKTRTDYQTVAAALVQDIEFRNKLRHVQQMTAQRLYCLDGRSRERIISLFDDLVALHSVRNSAMIDSTALL